MIEKKLSDAEIHLLIEESKRACVPIQLGWALGTPDNTKYPAMFLGDNLDPKKNYSDQNVQTMWSLAQSHGEIIAVYLDFDFEIAGKIKVFIDDFNPDLIKWLMLLVETKGSLVLAGSPPMVKKGIRVHDVPLDIPKQLINSFFIPIDIRLNRS